MIAKSNTQQIVQMRGEGMESVNFGKIVGYLQAYSEMASFYRGGISFRFELIHIPTDGDPLNSVKKYLISELDQWGADLSAWEKVFSKDTLDDFEYQIMNYPLDANVLTADWQAAMKSTIMFWFQSSLINHQEIEDHIYTLVIETRVKTLFEYFEALIGSRDVNVWQIDSMEHASFMNIFFEYLKNDNFIIQMGDQIALLHFGMSD